MTRSIVLQYITRKVQFCKRKGTIRTEDFVEELVLGMKPIGMFEYQLSSLPASEVGVCGCYRCQCLRLLLDSSNDLGVAMPDVGIHKLTGEVEVSLP